jgi:drug/metabolite transporter (DMT)-like permease
LTKETESRRKARSADSIDLGEKKPFSTDLCLILTMVIWGSDYPFAKIALREVSPLAFSAMRTLISTLILVPFFISQEKNWSVPWRHLLGLFFLALLGTFLNRICWSVGLNLTTASNSGLLSATSPIFVLLFSSLLLRNEVTRRAALGIAVAFLGVFLVIRGDWKGWEIKAENFQGDLIIVLGAVLWALFTVLAKKLLKIYSTLKMTAYVMVIGTILFLPFLPNTKSGGWMGISGLAWLGVLYVAIMGNGLAYFLWIRGIQNIGPMRTILYQYLMPITVILFSVPFLKESLTAMQVGGALVVFAGIFLARSG